MNQYENMYKYILTTIYFTFNLFLTLKSSNGKNCRRKPTDREMTERHKNRETEKLKVIKRPILSDSIRMIICGFFNPKFYYFHTQ